MNARPSLSVMFFSGSVPADRTDRYRLVHDAAAAADRLGYEAIWLPERHFDIFGGCSRIRPFWPPHLLAQRSGVTCAPGASLRRCMIR